MANSHKGEVSLKVGDKDYVVRLSTNTLCEMEDQFGKSFNEIMGELAEKPSIKGLRTVVCFALSENDPAPDEKEAGKIIDAAGGEAVNAALKQAIEIAFPPPPAKDGGEGNLPASQSVPTGKAS